MTKKAPTGEHRSEAHKALADREALLYEAHKDRGQDAVLDAIRADRRARWAELLEGREESAGVREWAASMTTLYKSGEVQIWKIRLPWITALYVARYGEAEDHWPSALTPDDLVRAGRWFRGDHPEGVHYAPAEG